MRALALPMVLLVAVSAAAEEPIDIGSRLEPLVDDHLIDSMSGGAKLVLHQPTEQEVALVHDAPWEGNNCAYHTVLRAGDEYRLFP